MKHFIPLFFLINLTIISLAQSHKEVIRIYREKYIQDFFTDNRSPLTKEDLQFLRFFDADETYRITTTFKKTENDMAFDMATLNGKTKKHIEYGKLSFSFKDKIFSLTLYQGIKLLENPELKDYLFLPFTDETNGNESYGSGRYLDFRISDINNNQLVVDFNMAYNPYCAYSTGFNCPKPPEENNLKTEIKAGEKKIFEKYSLMHQV